MLSSSLTEASFSTLSCHHSMFISRIFHCIWSQSMKHYHLKYLYGCNSWVNGLYREYSKYTPKGLKTHFILKYAHTSKSGTILTVLYKTGLMSSGKEENWMSFINKAQQVGRSRKHFPPFLKQVTHCHSGKILVWSEINVCDCTDRRANLNYCSV